MLEAILLYQLFSSLVTIARRHLRREQLGQRTRQRISKAKSVSIVKRF